MTHFIPTAERLRVAETVSRHARTAAGRPDREHIERQMIVGVLLDPGLGIVDDVVDRARPDGTLERELLVDYLTDHLYRKLASTDGAGFTLRALVDADPVDLVRSYVTQALRGAWQQVTRDRRRRATLREHATTLLSGTAQHTLPPDEIVYRRLMAPWMRRMDEVQDDAGASEWDIARLHAEGIREVRGLPAVTTPCNTVRRHLMELFDDPTEAETLEVLVSSTLGAQRALATGKPLMEHLMLDDDLMALWSGWEVDAIDALAGYDVREAVALVKGAVIFPPRPAEKELVEFRRLLRSLSNRPGWGSLATRLCRAWVAEWFSARNPYDRVTPAEHAERTRREAAAEWPTVVAEVLAFEGRPLGARIHDADSIHRRLQRQFEYLTGMLAQTG